MCQGLKDKLYWRPVVVSGLWCCFKKSADAKFGFVSLCGGYGRARSGGQQCARPPAILRCARCDVAEMKRRDKEESLLELSNWKEHQL